MLIELLRKEFIEGFAFEGKKGLGLLFSLLSKALLAALFVALECYIFLSLDKKIEGYSSYGTFDFLVFFLFAFMLAGTCLSAARARKVLFDRRDTSVSLPLPIDPGTIILSKVIYVYIQEALTSFLVATPLLICYGASRPYMPYFYVFSILYPFIITVFSCGISLLLVVPFQLVHNLIKDHPLYQFLLASLLVIALCFVYERVLTLFLTALSDSAIGGVFDKGFIEGLHKAVNFFVPVSSYLAILATGINILGSVSFLLGSLLLGVALGFGVSSLSYGYFTKKDEEAMQKKAKKEGKSRKTPSEFQVLLKKEFELLFMGKGNLFNYTALLVMIPFLSYLVVSSLNGIVYRQLEIFTVYFPELPNALNLALILLFISVSTANVSLSISSEGKTLAILKTLPYEPSKMLLVKLLPPFALSSFSMLLSLLALLIGGEIPWSVFGIGLLLGLCYLTFALVFGLLLDMRSRFDGAKNLSFLVPLFSFLFPLLILAIHALLSIYGVPTYGIYLLEAAIGLLLLPFALYRLPKRLTSSFYRMEVQA